MTDAWPAGWRLQLDPGARRVDGGRALIGGAPLRVMRLSDDGARWLDAIAASGPVPGGSTSAALAWRLVDGGLAHPVPSATDGPTRDDVAVVIPVRNDADGLARTVAGIGRVAELVVVDDGSHDPMAIEHAAGPDATVLRHHRSLGPAAARETGWRTTSQPFVAFVDADVTPGPHWLRPLLPLFADDAAGLVAPRVIAEAGCAPRWLAEYEAVRSPLDLGSRPAAIRPGSPVPYVPTTAVVVRRAALEQVGGFDTDLRFGEDVDLVWRLHDAGWRLRYEPESLVAHPTRPTVGAWLAQRAGYGTSAAPLAARHDDAVAPLRGMSGWSALAWGSVLLGHPVVGVAIAAGTTAALAPNLRTLEHPLAAATRIAGTGHLWAGRSVADALRRPWWPFALGLGAVSRRARPALVAAMVVPALIEWRTTRPALDPVRYGLLRLADDLAYGTGVWRGCLRARSLRAVRPAFSGPLPDPR